MTAARWIVTGVALAAAVISTVVALASQRHSESLDRQLSVVRGQLRDQDLVNLSIVATLREQKKLNAQLAQYVIRLMHQRSVYPTRSLASSTP